jgi:putative ABC transport system permease protein
VLKTLFPRRAAAGTGTGHGRRIGGATGSGGRAPPGRCAKGMPDASASSTYSISCGAGSVIALMTWLGVIDTPITTMVPEGSMLIAYAMNTNRLALNRFRFEVLAHVGEIETALALGADAKSSVAPYVQTRLKRA